MRIFPANNTNMDIREILKYATWNISKIGINLYLYYITIENMDFVSEDTCQDIRVLNLNLHNNIKLEDFQYSIPEERKHLFEKWVYEKEPILYAIHENDIIGFIAIKTKDIKIFGIPIGDNKNDFYVHYIYVSPEHRGRGIAQRLRSESFKIMREIKTGNCYSYIDFTNKSAIRSATKSGVRFLSLNLFLSTKMGKRIFRCRLLKFKETA